MTRDKLRKRESTYSSATRRISHAASLAEGVDGVRGFKVLDQQVEEICSILDQRLEDLTGRIVQFEVSLCHQHIEMLRPHLPLSERAEMCLLVRFVVNGNHSRIPVLWQHVSSSISLASFTLAMNEDVLPEIEAAVIGLPLKEERRCAVLLEPWLASQFIHECVGHTVEADNWVHYSQPKGIGIGYQWSDYPLQVFDDPTIPGHRASYDFDFDGTAAQRTILIQDGVWHGLLLNLDYQQRLTHASSGNGRRVLQAEQTLPRMSITYADAGRETLAELIESVEDGIYCRGTWGGRSFGRKFILRPAYGQIIRDGQLTGTIVRRFDIFGDKFDTMRNVVGMSNDLRFFDPVFGCDKFGQDNLPITCGAPDLLLSEAAVRPF
jgi:hypothetical protein